MNTAEFNQNILKLFLYIQFISFFLTVGGSWCSYEKEKLVPCRIQNGTESHLSRNICWKSLNGSLFCNKRVVYKPKYITTYKKVKESKWKCCPGFTGQDCKKECFNCLTYELLEKRLQDLEANVKKDQKFMRKTEDFDKNENKEGSGGIRFSQDDDEDFGQIFLNVVSSLREMELRVKMMENQVLSLNKELAFAKLRSSDTITSQKSEPIVAESKESPILRGLEKNLERGDIASTLNDDYGDEQPIVSATEEYIDQLSRSYV